MLSEADETDAGAAIEQARAEAALRASERKHRDLFEKMEEGYLIGDVVFEDGRAVDVEYVEANPAAILMIGAEVVSRRMRDVDPNYEEYWYELYGRVASSGITERDTRYAAPVDRWYDYRMAKLDPGDTDSRRVSVLFSDASARVSAELSLRESEERYAADDLRRELTRLGATVIGPAPTLERVLDLIEDAEQIDGAVLDINLGGVMVYPAADLLSDRLVPFLFATGYDKSVIPSRFDIVTRCEKPFGPDKIAQALTELVGTSGS